MTNKKTTEQFNIQLHNKYPNIVTEDEYVNGTTKLSFRCLIDDYKWNSTPNNTLDKGCPYCKGTAYEKRASIFYEKANNNKHVRILGKYQSKDKNIECECAYCNDIFKMNPDSIISGKVHRKCYYKVKGGKPNKSQEQFVEEVNQNYGDEITVLGEYTKAKNKIKIRHKCGYEWDVIADSLIGKNKLIGCPKCSKVYRLSNEEYVEELKRKNPTIIPIEPYVNSNTKIKHKCLICDFEWDVIPHSVLHCTRGCPMCKGGTNAVVIGINDMWTTNPEIAKMLADKNDGYKYTSGTSKRVQWRCKDCGELIGYKSIHKVKERGLFCKRCSPVNSLPNRIMYNMLSELHVDFEDEKVFDWCKFKINNKNKTGRYDFYFVYNNIQYIVEMDGKFHFENNKLSGQTKTMSQIIDEYKDLLAHNHNIHIIRINCINSTVDFIKQNILKSELSELFDLSNINWEKCFYNSTTPIMKDVCNDFNNGMHIKDIAIKYNKCSETITKFLDIGTKSGICNYIHNLNKRRVVCFNDKKIFESINSASRYYNIQASQISMNVRQKINNIHNVVFMYYEDYVKLYGDIKLEEIAS